MTFVPYSELAQTAYPVAHGVVAVLPLAAVEAHGPHLPLGTDGMIADGILDRAAMADSGRDRLVLRLPALWLGASAEHADRPGTLTIEPESLAAQIVAIAEGLASAGLGRIVLFNAHGGNVAVASTAVLRLRTRFDMLAVNAHWLDFGLPPEFDPPTPAVADVHGGWIETSAMLHLAPHLVDRNALAPATPNAPAPSLFPSGPIAWGWKAADLGTDSLIGRPDLARSDIGEALVAHAAARLLILLDEVAGAHWPEPGVPAR